MVKQYECIDILRMLSWKVLGWNISKIAYFGDDRVPVVRFRWRSNTRVKVQRTTLSLKILKVAGWVAMINPAACQGFSSCTFNMKLLLGDFLMMNLVVSHFADLRILVSLGALTMCAPPKKTWNLWVLWEIPDPCLKIRLTLTVWRRSFMILWVDNFTLMLQWIWLCLFA